jgi:hypothetical protein
LKIEINTLTKGLAEPRLFLQLIHTSSYSYASNAGTSCALADNILTGNHIGLYCVSLQMMQMTQ